MVLDDSDRFRKVQLKSLIVGSTKKAWEIQKNLLRPDLYRVEPLGFMPEPPSTGLGGAVVLQIVTVGDAGIDVEYAYTDIGLIVAFVDGLIAKTTKTPSVTKMTKLKNEIVEGERTETVTVPLSAFIRVRTPGMLLAALGLASPDSLTSHNLLQLVGNAREQSPDFAIVLRDFVGTISADFGAGIVGTT